MITSASDVLCKCNHLDPPKELPPKEHALETFETLRMECLCPARRAGQRQSFGQPGPEHLNFLWALADHDARIRVSVPRPIVPVQAAPAQTAARARLAGSSISTASLSLTQHAHQRAGCSVVCARARLASASRRSTEALAGSAARRSGPPRSPRRGATGGAGGARARSGLLAPSWCARKSHASPV